MGIYLRFEDDSVDSAKVVKQWNVKIISVSGVEVSFMLEYTTCLCACVYLCVCARPPMLCTS